MMIKSLNEDKFFKRPFRSSHVTQIWTKLNFVNYIMLFSEMLIFFL